MIQRKINKDNLIDKQKNRIKKTIDNLNVSIIHNDKIEIKEEISIKNKIKIKENLFYTIKNEL